jgi:hypothetical protein
MVWKNYIDGEVLYAADLNASLKKALSLGVIESGLNTIRQLQDRSIIFSKNSNDVFADAYTTAAGRLSSVNTTPANTTAIFSAGNLEYGTTYLNRAGTDTITSSASRGGWSNTGLSFDSNNSTFASMSASWTSATTTETWTLGTTWVGAVAIGTVYVNTSFSGTVSGDTRSATISLEWFNGSVWAIVGSALASSSSTNWGLSYNGNVVVNQASVQGLRLNYSRATGSSSAYTASISQTELQYGSVATDSIIEHTIPAGTFPATISKAIGIGMLSQIETGAGMQFKLQNGTEDTGWIDCYNYPQLTTFTAFTSQPTKLIIKLVAKPTTGTVGIPAIKGFSVYADNT